MANIEKYLGVAIDVDKLENSLRKRVRKVGEKAHNLTIIRYKLEDEIEKIQKKMKKHGIKELAGLGVNEDPYNFISNSMA